MPNAQEKGCDDHVDNRQAKYDAELRSDAPSTEARRSSDGKSQENRELSPELVEGKLEVLTESGDVEQVHFVVHFHQTYFHSYSLIAIIELPLSRLQHFPVKLPCQLLGFDLQLFLRCVYVPSAKLLPVHSFAAVLRLLAQTVQSHLA